MKILITGATGFVGSHLSGVLKQDGHTIAALSRNAESARRRLPHVDQIFSWNPQVELLPSESLDGVDAVVNLLGESIQGRWTDAKKQEIYNSRVLSVRNLVDSIARAAAKPGILVSANGIGYYGDRGEEQLTEESPPGSGFMAGLSQDWENEALRARELGVRVVSLRSGLVLGNSGGPLLPLVKIAKLGGSGPLGPGRQWWSWIHLGDSIGLIKHALNTEVAGAINATAPHPIRQCDLAHLMGKLLRRPAFMPAPSFALRLVLGEMSTELLASRRAFPKRAQESGYQFQFPDMETALRSLLAD